MQLISYTNFPAIQVKYLLTYHAIIAELENFIYGIVTFIRKALRDSNKANFLKLIVADMYRNYIVLIKWMSERLGFT